MSVRYETISEGQTDRKIAQLNKVHILEKLLKITSNLSKMLTKAPKHNSNKNHWQGARAPDRGIANLLSLPLTKAGFGFQQTWGALQQYISTAYIAGETVAAVVLLTTPDCSTYQPQPSCGVLQWCGLHRALWLTVWWPRVITGVDNAVVKHQGLFPLQQQWERVNAVTVGKTTARVLWGPWVSLPVMKWYSYLSLQDEATPF